MRYCLPPAKGREVDLVKPPGLEVAEQRSALAQIAQAVALRGGGQVLEIHLEMPLRERTQPCLSVINRSSSALGLRSPGSIPVGSASLPLAASELEAG